MWRGASKFFQKARGSAYNEYATVQRISIGIRLFSLLRTGVDVGIFLTGTKIDFLETFQ